MRVGVVAVGTISEVFVIIGKKLPEMSRNFSPEIKDIFLNIISLYFF
jgi:hypothetical protein